MSVNIHSNPVMMEINTLPFMSGLSRKYDKRLTLASIPAEEWQRYRELGFDLIWLMGVWQRSPAARQLAIDDIGLREVYDRVLPGWTEDDIAGSPYAVYDYSPDKRLGKKGDLFKLKNRLNKIGLGLILDFVPNHLALDHPWTVKHPGWFIKGTKKASSAHPGWFFTTKNGDFLAHGRDPNFAPWQDTAQLNFFSREMRRTLIDELIKISDVADGVRCDMAMLGLNSVFQQVWGEICKQRNLPAVEFWAEAISAVKAKHPSFIFIAEVYWGLDDELRKLGFDFSYDKVLYDRLRYDNAEQIQEYIQQRDFDLKHMLHYIENHDELRATEIFGVERSLMAAVTASTIPGMRFFYEGQLDGLGTHIPVQLARAPEKRGIAEISKFYSRLLNSCTAPVFRQGTFIPANPRQAWDGNNSNHRLLCWFWRYGEQCKLIAINYSNEDTQGRIHLPLSLENGSAVVCYDELADTTYNSPAEEVHKSGLYISLNPWQAHILDIKIE